MLTTMSDSTWTVRVRGQLRSGKNFSRTWIYTFSRKGTVNWRDPLNGETGKGFWRFERGKLVTRWFGSKTVERWDLPIEKRAATGLYAATGKYEDQEGTLDLKAEAINYLELDPVVIKTFKLSCDAARHKVQKAQFKFSSWLSGIAIAYEEAFKAHMAALNGIAATKKLTEDLLFGFALAFLGGAVGAKVGEAMKIISKDDVMINGIKDLAKFSVKEAGAATYKSKDNSRMPTSPLQWQNKINKRFSDEMAKVLDDIDDWSDTADKAAGKDNFAFDPETEVEKALVMKLDTGNLNCLDPPALDDKAQASLQRDFERGWLVAWIRLNARPVSPFDLPTLFEMEKIENYIKRLGDNSIKELLDKEWPPARGTLVVYP